MSDSSHWPYTMCKRCCSGIREDLEREENEAEAETSEESREDEASIDEGEVHDAL